MFWRPPKYASAISKRTVRQVLLSVVVIDCGWLVYSGKSMMPDPSY